MPFDLKQINFNCIIRIIFIRSDFHHPYAERCFTVVRLMDCLLHLLKSKFHRSTFSGLSGCRCWHSEFVFR